MEETKSLAHVLEAKIRTSDVEIDRNVTFEQLGLPRPILSGLKRNKFTYPSPIQQRAIPLGSCGRDLFVQAKSGTGKTLVFSILALEKALEKPSKPLTTLVLAPTREIAVQITGVIAALGAKVDRFSVQTVIGGTEVDSDRRKVAKASCVVGTPGRVAHLIRNRVINAENVDLLVLDEADKLVSDAFLPDVSAIASACRSRTRQTMVVSATFDRELERALGKLMRDPIGVTPKREVPVLVGISQFVLYVPVTENILEEMRSKVEALSWLLTDLTFNQCLIFVNSQSRAESYCNLLIEKGFLTDFITGAQDQSTRLKTFERIQGSHNCSIIVTTDLLARGIDAERVNLVVNLEPASDEFCYLHRIGRAGRFGSLGLAVNFVAPGDELMKFKGNLVSEQHPIYVLNRENAKFAWEEQKEGKFETIFGGKKEVSDGEQAGNEENGAKNGGLRSIFEKYESQQEERASCGEKKEESEFSAELFLKKIQEIGLLEEKNGAPEAEKEVKREGEEQNGLPGAERSQTVSLNPAEAPSSESEEESERVDSLGLGSEASEEESDSDDGINSTASECDSESDVAKNEFFPDEMAPGFTWQALFPNGFPENSLSSEPSLNGRYQTAYAHWMNSYWNQATQIQDYVKYSQFVQRGGRGFSGF